MCVSLFPKGNLKSIRCTQICWNGEFHLRVSSSTSTNENAWHFHHLNTISTTCIVSIHHFPGHHHQHRWNPPFPLGYPTLVPTSPPGGDWDQVSGAAKVSWCHQKKTGENGGKFLREVSYLTPCNIYQIELIEIPDNLQIPLGGVI